MSEAWTGITPERIEIRNGGGSLGIVWPDGRRDELGARLLRAECRSAGARRALIEGIAPLGDNPRIANVSPVGLYAVNIAFSDGEQRSIYPWAFLAELARRAAGEDETQPPSATEASIVRTHS